MTGPAWLFSEPGSSLPPIEHPFGTLLDADDNRWTNVASLREASIMLIEAGCRWIVCFGERSENVHDRIDDYIVEQSVSTGRSEYESVVTTFHADESVDDAAEFFLNCALQEMSGALILVQNKDMWSAALSRIVMKNTEICQKE